MPRIQARYGPLSLSIWTKNGSGQISTAVFDTRVRRNVFREVAERTLEEAQQQAITVAQEKLDGMPREVEWKMPR